MSQHHARQGDKRQLVIFREGYWWRSNSLGEFSLISSRHYKLPPGIFDDSRECRAVKWGLIGLGVGMLIGILLTGVSLRG